MIRRNLAFSRRSSYGLLALGSLCGALAWPALTFGQSAHPAAPQPAAAQPAAASAADAIEVRGEVTTPGALTVRELSAMATVQADWTVHGKTRKVLGVPLGKALERFGVSPGPMSKQMAPKDKRPGYKKVIVASALDGFQAVLSVAEISEGMGKTQALLVFQIDGQPLRADEKPLRLVVLSDGEPSRSLYQLNRIDIVDLRKIIPPAQAPAPPKK